ncbi:hypothetical protein Ancab_039785 [Ancistrocladus abbreviatus]
MMISRFLLHLTLVSLWLTVSMSQQAQNIALSGCKDKCGNVRIPYPFGIGADCALDPWYEIVCNASFHPNKPFLRRLNLEVMEITLGWEPPTVTVSIPPPNICTGVSDLTPVASSIDLRRSPYLFDSHNVFVVVGCWGSVVLMNRTKEVLAGCATSCQKNNTSTSNNCYGAGCCQTPIQTYLDFYQIGFNDGAVSDAKCMTAGLSINPSERLSSADPFSTNLVWMVDLPIGSPSYQKAFCFRYLDALDELPTGVNTQGYTCRCQDTYEGNPYLPNGCRVVKGCEKCAGSEIYCITGENGENHCKKKLWVTLAPILGVSIGAGTILLLLGCYSLYRVLKRRKKIKQRAKFFKRNGGLLLQQQMNSNEGIVEKTKIFTTYELEKATDNFNENRILGQGGQGTVYKGMLMDGGIVAIKKSKQVDEDQLDQFINEVVILSQVNHRNVVKLLGCCLETEVPLLVYEFVPSGTLAKHIHDPSEDFQISWKMRLQIAADAAGAVAYLHSSSSAPIYHRDIKSSNILLDDKYRAKVSDFGISRAITIDQTHLTTCVQGTFGYLDPEYFHSSQFTEKSDVYSFGVVLAELLTSKKSVYATESQEWRGLAIDLLFMMETSCLHDILDDRVLHEATQEEIYAVANLAKKCLNLNGKVRPTMKEVAMVLDRVRSVQVSESTSSKSEFLVSKICKADVGPLSLSTLSLEVGSVFSFDNTKPLLFNTH